MTIRNEVTVEEFLRWPEQKPYLELIHGVVQQKTMGNDAHSFLQSQFARWLGNWCKPADGFTLTEQRCILQADGEEHVVLPDVAWFTHQQLPALVGGPVRVPPSLAIEILSPDDRFGDVLEKVTLYLAAGVPLVWVVDPVSRNVSIYRPAAAPQVVAPPATLEDTLLPGFRIPLEELFAFLPAPGGKQPPVRE